MRVALLGTRGVPAHYGGFETAVEEIGAGLVERGHNVTVYCRKQTPGGSHHRGMRRVVLPALRKRSLETLSHAGVSALHCLRHRPDAVVVYNAANAPWVGLLRAFGIPTALHIDGHDERRAKWAGWGARYYKGATRWGARFATELLVDSEAMQAEVDAKYGVRSTFIAYGAIRTPFTDAELAETLARRPRDAGRLPPDREPLRAGEPGPGDDPGLHREQQQASRCSSWASPATPVITTRRFASQPRRTNGFTCSARSGTRSSSTRCSRAARPTCTATRSAGPTPRCCAGWRTAHRSSPTTASTTRRPPAAPPCGSPTLGQSRQQLIRGRGRAGGRTGHRRTRSGAGRGQLPLD